MSEWQDISTAPKDGNTLIRLRNDKWAPAALFYWNKARKHWGTKVMAVLGWRDACWDEDVEQPTEWMPT